MALAIAALSGIQVLLICGGTLRVLPLTGLNLPLVSSGGTSMVATLFALGIVVGIGTSQTSHGREPDLVLDPSAPANLLKTVPRFQPLPAIQKDAYTADD